MKAEQIFLQFPDADECWQAGNSEFFLKENEANDYAKHFNVSKKKILRSEVFPDEVNDEGNKPEDDAKAKAAEAKAKEEADAKTKAAEAKAKEEADAKTKAAEAKAKEEADAKTKAAEAKAKEEADAKTKAAEAKAKEEAEKKAAE